MIERIESSSSAALRSGLAAADHAAQQVAAATSAPFGLATGIPDFAPDENLLGESMEEFPPAFVFAPGFLHADRRGLVPYPGLQIAEGVVGMLLARRYVQGVTDVVDAVDELSAEVTRVGDDG